MSESKRQSIKQSLKLLPLYCMTKGSDEGVDKHNDAPKARLQVPEPIDEFVDYTTDAFYERSLKASQQVPEIVLVTTENGGEECSCSSDSGGPAVEEVIAVSVSGQAETGIPSNVGAQLSVGNPASTSAPHSVRRAEGLSIGSERSPRGSSGQRHGNKEAPTAEAESQGALHQLRDLMTDDGEVFATGSRVSVRESAVEPLVAGSVNASHSITDTARSGGDPSDVQALKRTVRRLTSELSRLLTGKSSDEVEARKLLPGKGPLPPWLCDPRVFSPLMAAYDQQLLSAAKSGGVGDSGSGGSVDAKLLDMEARVLDVARENERLRVKLRESATAGPASQTELDAFTEQARLVLEENQLLIHQLRLQQDKAKLMQRGHLAEVAALKCRIEELEAEKGQVRSQFDGLHGKLQEVRDKYQSATLERETGELLTVDRMRTLTKELAGTRDEFARTNEELLHQLQKSERQKVKLTRALADATTERDELRIEVSELKNSAHLRYRENLQLQRSVKRRDTMEDYLESVLSTATELQSELDGCKGKLKHQETDLNKLIDFLVGELTFYEKNITGKSKLPSLTSKFELVIKSFAALLKGSENEREQMDKQIRYLQSLIRQKSQELQFLEAEQRTVEAGLETVWNIAASS